MAVTPWLLSAFADEAGAEIEEQIAGLTKAGMSHVDLRAVSSHNISNVPEDVAKDAKAKLDAAGITVAMFGSPIGKIDLSDDFGIDQQRMEHLAKMKDIFGCNAVRMFSYYDKDGKLSADERKTKSLDWLKQLRDQAGKLGLVLYHENERGIFGGPCANNRVIADELRDGDVFKMIFDFDNYNQENEDVWETWQQLKNVTDAFHFKDSTAPPEPMHVPLGEGNGQVERILKDAIAIGWSGPASVEPHLSHSKAVMATGPSGASNQALSEMTPAETFEIATNATKALLAKIDVPWR